MSDSGYPCYLSSSCLRSSDLEDMLQECEKNDVFHLELSAPYPDKSIDEIERIIIQHRKRGFEFTIHNYFPAGKKNLIMNIASGDTDVQIASKDIVFSALRLAKSVNSPVYGIHAGYLSDGNADRNGYFQFEKKKLDYPCSLKQASNFITSVCSYFSDNGISLVIENLFPNVMTNYSLFCSMPEIDDLMRLLPDSVGLLLDLGHLNISSKLLGFDKFNFLKKYLEIYGSRIYEVHLSDNNGSVDEHLPLKKGSWQLDVLKDIVSILPMHSKERIYCLEARKCSMKDVKSSLDLIGGYITSK